MPIYRASSSSLSLFKLDRWMVEAEHQAFKATSTQAFIGCNFVTHGGVRPTNSPEFRSHSVAFGPSASRATDGRRFHCFSHLPHRLNKPPHASFTCAASDMYCMRHRRSAPLLYVATSLSPRLKRRHDPTDVSPLLSTVSLLILFQSLSSK
ncbi:hypothetical protein CROQUDRAFT_91998 [Cronartium quercuum f. sp. fusiforme G11]|uniref:Uncharacterized protein n=1 Tax=Cronartium quercuum f. sp. fusiforme G11 TaxID=708437 RepID=A0A9P6NJA1_9BASI|nr:hypothetical protein CROQUDRAFT_91998 [Cronartium quercuum f. sp. fusiforme G11]